MWHMYGNGYNYWWIWMLVSHIIGLLVFVGVVVLVIKLINKGRMGQDSSYSSKSLDILNERYINGEINEEEYMRMKKLLKD